MLIWHNNDFKEMGNTLSPLSHALNYGCGVFEGIRSYKLKDGGVGIFRLKEHIERLYYSSSCLNLSIPYTSQELISVCKEVIKRNNLKDAYIRPLVVSSSNAIGLGSIKDVDVYIFAVPFDKYLSSDAVKVVISPFRRVSPQISFPDAKITGNYVNSIISTLYARKLGYDESLMLDLHGRIAEGPGENIMFIQDDVLVVPRSDSILKGITRNSVMVFAKDLGYEVEERDVYPHDLSMFDEAFFTGTAVEITPIKKINDITYSTRKSKRIKEYYNKIVRGEVDAYKMWIERV